MAQQRSAEGNWTDPEPNWWESDPDTKEAFERLIKSIENGEPTETNILHISYLVGLVTGKMMLEAEPERRIPGWRQLSRSIREREGHL